MPTKINLPCSDCAAISCKISLSALDYFEKKNHVLVWYSTTGQITSHFVNGLKFHRLAGNEPEKKNHANS